MESAFHLPPCGKKKKKSVVTFLKPKKVSSLLSSPGIEILFWPGRRRVYYSWKEKKASYLGLDQKQSLRKNIMPTYSVAPRMNSFAKGMTDGVSDLSRYEKQGEKGANATISNPSLFPVSFLSLASVPEPWHILLHRHLHKLRQYGLTSPSPLFKLFIAAFVTAAHATSSKLENLPVLADKSTFFFQKSGGIYPGFGSFWHFLLHQGRPRRGGGRGADWLRYCEHVRAQKAS